MLRAAPTVSSSATARPHPPIATVRVARKLVIVNGSTESAAMVEAMLDGGRYDMVFVASTAQAYSQIKQEQPNLVVLCLEPDRVEGFQVLSMLKLDEATRCIPIVTVSTEGQGDGDVPRIIQDDEGEADESPERFFAPRGPVVMN